MSHEHFIEWIFLRSLLLVFFSYVIFQCFGFNFFGGVRGLSGETGGRLWRKRRRPEGGLGGCFAKVAKPAAGCGECDAACWLLLAAHRITRACANAVHYEVASFSSPGLRTIVRRTCQLLDRSLPRRLRTSSIQSAHQLARHHVPTDT